MAKEKHYNRPKKGEEQAEDPGLAAMKERVAAQRDSAAAAKAGGGTAGELDKAHELLHSASAQRVAEQRERAAAANRARDEAAAKAAKGK